MRLEIGQRIFVLCCLPKLLNRKLRPAVIAGYLNLDFNNIPGLERLGAGFKVVPHLRFALSGAVRQPQRQIDGAVALAAELLLRDSEEVRDRLALVFRDFAEEDGLRMSWKQRALTHRGSLTAAVGPVALVRPQECCRPAAWACRCRPARYRS